METVSRPRPYFHSKDAAGLNTPLDAFQQMDVEWSAASLPTGLLNH